MRRPGNRRQFLATTTLFATSALFFPSVTKASSNGDRRFILSTPLTHSDWMLKPGVEWGPEGVRQMLNACNEWGFSKIYWRVLDGGRALYKSKLLHSMGRWDADSFWSPQSVEDRELVQRFNPGMTEEARRALMRKFEALDYSRFDPLAEAVPYAHKLGMQIHAWVTVNEDDHGWGLQSEFSKRHAEFRWRRRNGRVYRSQLSFAFPDVRKYKLAILRELLTGYELDGFFIDWIRTGDVRDNPQNDEQGHADYGYESPLVKSYQRKHGKPISEVANGNVEWIRHRAQAQTLFMRQARKLLKRKGRALPVSVLVGHPWHYRGLMNKIDGNLRGLLLDATTWAEEKLMDAAVAAGYYLDGGTLELAWNSLRSETSGKVDVWTYAWVPQNPGELEQTMKTAEKVGARQILFWEADYIHDRPADLARVLRARAV